jgi:hypothetical protein
MGQLSAATSTGITHSYGNAGFTPNCYYIQSYAYRSQSNYADHLNWINNSLIKTPKTSGMVYYRDYSTITAGKILDLSGNGNDGTLVNYSTAETTPTDPAYAVVPIMDIRLKDAPSTDLILDLDAREGITLASGKISQWKSKVGSYIAYENDVNRQPTWERSTGVPGVAFGVSNSLIIDNFDLSITDEIGILIFGKFNSSVGSKVVLEHGPNYNTNINNWLIAEDSANSGPQMFHVGEYQLGLQSTGRLDNGTIASNVVVMGGRLSKRSGGYFGADYGTFRTGITHTSAKTPSTYGNLALNIGNRSGAAIGMDGIINRILIYKSHAAYEQARRYLGLKHKSAV